MRENYYDKKLKAHLPVFGFFKSDHDPVIRMEVGCDNKGKTAIRNYDSYNNKVQPGFNMEKTIQFWPKFYLRFRTIMNFFIVAGLFIMLDHWLYVSSCAATDDITQKNFDVVIEDITSIFGVLFIALRTSFLSENTGHYSRTFSTSLRHVIPDSVAQVMEDNKDKFNVGVFIVAQVENQWTVEDKMVLPRFELDPLVVGVHHDNFNGYKYYLLHKFDLAPKEAYITGSEFLLKDK